MTQRQEGIDTKSPHTFEWIFENDELAFTKWLRSGEQLYWIRGKPGSGKSTLMKFIHNDARTRELLKDWKNAEEPIVASFFFHHRGSVLQKSLDGLLRSILVQILQQRPWLADVLRSTVEEVIDERFPLKEQWLKKKLQNQEWKQCELWKMLCQVLGQTMEKLDICFFFDALDEYDGAPDVIKDFLGDLQKESSSGLTSLKICFSSRCWDPFVQSFSNNPGFPIHDHTTDDIQAYCYETLENCGEVAVVIEPLVREITATARGVFLWARLALRDLIKAGSRTRDPDVLQEKLKTLPKELNDYYEEIVRRCHRSLRMKAYVLLEIATRSDEMLTLPHVSTILACYSPATFEACRAAIQNKKIESRDFERTQKIIANACGGLLEVKKSGRIWYIQLMHQTVREFVLGPKFKTLVLENRATFEHENGHSFLGKFYLTQRGIELTSTEKFLSPVSMATVAKVRYHLKGAEMTTGRNQLKFLASFTPRLLTAILQARGWADPRYQDLPFAQFNFATHAGLHLCLEELITKQYLSNEEKEAALIQFLSFIGVSRFFQRGDLNESIKMLHLLEFKVKDSFRRLLVSDRLKLISPYPVVRLPNNVMGADDNMEIAFRFPTDSPSAPPQHDLNQQPATIMLMNDDLLSIVQIFLEKQSHSDKNPITPFQAGTMICNSSFVRWIFRKNRRHTDLSSWPQTFVEWAVIFWSIRGCDQETLPMSLALVRSAYDILEVLEDDEQELQAGQNLAMTKLTAWPAARHNLLGLEGCSGGLPRPSQDHRPSLKLCQQLVIRLDELYSGSYSDDDMQSNTAKSEDCNADIQHDDVKIFDDANEANDQLEHAEKGFDTERKAEPVATHLWSVQETSTVPELSNRNPISALRKTFKTRIKTAFTPSH
jgi:hypothetical protein